MKWGKGGRWKYRSWFRGCKWDRIVFLVGGWSCLACLSLVCLLPEFWGPNDYGRDAVYVQGTKKWCYSQKQFVFHSKIIFFSLHFQVFPASVVNCCISSRISPSRFSVCAYPLSHLCVSGCAGCCLCPHGGQCLLLVCIQTVKSLYPRLCCLFASPAIVCGRVCAWVRKKTQIQWLEVCAGLHCVLLKFPYKWCFKCVALLIHSQ